MSSVHNITPVVMAMHEGMQDDHATIARTSSISQRSISSSITEKHASVPAMLPDEAVFASKKDVDHEYQFKCDDPENGVNKQTSMSDVEQQQQQQQQDTDMDGGYGWLVILGTFMVQVTSFGTASCW
ncbi:uncharacterized protein ATC70_006068 [Mucor velutinosus]|uniref:Uncharacterized protein n=1 Tax=Mucor velutinosus TaxID=708070 RepID=A0AAN7DDY3_9FUNG|nr:hypothetical protein ATC70_006068 [Mucor velutinosus]